MFALLGIFLFTVTAKEQPKIRTLIVTGQDGSHYWRGASECMRQILANTGRFDVDVIETPDWGGDMSTFNPDFKAYSLSLSTMAVWSGSSRARRLSRNMSAPVVVLPSSTHR